MWITPKVGEPPLIVPADHKMKKWRLLADVCYETEDRSILINAPKGFVCDLASVPRIFHGLYKPQGKYGKAAIVHDFLCRERFLPSKKVHKIFHEAMRADGVPKLRAWIMYTAVRIGGPHF
jgi:hypothetical protein